MTPVSADREPLWAVALALAAALRVFVFSAAFPFFTNVDEHRHVDAVLKYARGYVPHPDDTAYEPEMPGYLGIYGSPEYHMRPEALGPEGVPPPPWRRPPGEMLGMIDFNRRYLAKRPNLESFQPPVYYATAGAWLRLGRAIGLEGGPMLYWIRQLNVLSVFLLVLACYASLRGLYPENRFLRLAPPALLAVFPLDVFYYATPDAFSPLLAGVAFFGALWLVRGSGPPVWGYAGAGLAGAAAVLCKYTNAALVPVLALATAIRLVREPSGPARRGALAKCALLWGLLLGPVGLWLLRNQLVLGDPLGTAFKVERLGWGERPLAQYLDHPIFRLEGLVWFLRELVPMFWRGEIVWYREILSIPAADRFYTWSTAALLALAVLGLRRRPGEARRAEGLALAAVAAGVATLALLSLPFLFGQRTNPTAARPFFFHGRLISGVMAPFLLAYARGLEVAAGALPGRAARPAAWAGLAIVVAVALGSEIVLGRDVLASRYNWFGLP